MKKRRRRRFTVNDVKFVLAAGIDTTRSLDVAVLDSHINSCIFAAKQALQNNIPAGYSKFETEHLVQMLDSFCHSHKSIRILLRGEQSASAVDALAISRLQVETLYSFCFLLQDSENVRLFVRNGWKKKYIRFLLEREERGHLAEFKDYYSNIAPTLLRSLQQICVITDDQRLAIEAEQLGEEFVTQPPGGEIPDFPSPGGVIGKIRNADQKRMLIRLYPEYQYLCSFAHGDTEALFFRTVSDRRSPFQGTLGGAEVANFYQREVLEAPVTYSALCAVQAATEVAAVCRADVNLLVKVSEAWELLSKVSVIALPIWEMRARGILPLINTDGPDLPI